MPPVSQETFERMKLAKKKGEQKRDKRKILKQLEELDRVADSMGISGLE
jgi:hypothetical protein